MTTAAPAIVALSSWDWLQLFLYYLSLSLLAVGGAITVAPDKRATPVTIAILPSVSIFAPMRFSSATCMKRFSKIVSLTVLVPSEIALIAIN